MRVIEGMWPRAAAKAGGAHGDTDARRRRVRYILGTVVAAGPAGVSIMTLDSKVHRLQLGRRTLRVVAGRPVSSVGTLRAGSVVRAAFVDTGDDDLAIWVEELTRHGGRARASQGPASFAAPAPRL